MTVIEIHQAHGEAIQERMQMMRTLFNQFQLLKQEDKRHVDAVLRTLAQDPDEFETYELRVDKGHYYLQLNPKQQVPQPEALAPQTMQHVNGAAVAEV